MTVAIIAAVAKNNVIGKDNDLIWDLPDDMKFFTSMTKGKPVIMGRKNYDSIPEKYRPLPGRRNIVITRKTDFDAPECDVVNSIESALKLVENEELVFIIGGGQIYELALEKNVVDLMYLTEIDAEFDGDAFFPDFDKAEWEEEVIDTHSKDERHAYPFVFKSFRKK